MIDDHDSHRRHRSIPDIWRNFCNKKKKIKRSLISPIYHIDARFKVDARSISIAEAGFS
jgi:hypothetical protein